MKATQAALVLLNVCSASTLLVWGAEERHADLQAVTAAGTSAWGGAFPFTIRGILLCDPQDMLDPTPTFLPWDDGANMGRMGGEWQVTFQAVAAGDRGGTTCWMGQNYGNQPWLHDSALSYGNEAWTAEILRLSFDAVTMHGFRAGDLIEVTVRQSLFYGGKRNINEGHDTDASLNFDIALVTASYGLPEAEVISLAEVAQPGGTAEDPASWQFIFDPTRATGAEHYQGIRVRINDLTLLTTNGWNAANLWSSRKCTVTDGAGRFLTLRHPRYSLGEIPTERFDAVGIFTQESGSSAQGTNGYELFAQQIIPQEPVAMRITSRIAIAWPRSGAIYQLEHRADLGSADWQPVTNAPVAIDGQSTVLVPTPPGPAEQFYRLRKTN
jgi:hypothetical protein